MDDQCYLLPSKYKDYVIGSLLEIVDGELIDLERKLNEGYIDKISRDWILISIEEALFLSGKNIDERIHLYNSNEFYKINNLTINNKCHYFDGHDHILCTINDKYYDQKKLMFTISSEFQQYNVKGSQISIPTIFIEQYQEIEEIMELLLKRGCDILKVDQNKQCILLLAYTLKCKCCFQMFVNTHANKFDVSQNIIEHLFQSMVKEKQWSDLEVLLKKCNLTQNDSEFLMDLTLTSLKKGNHELLSIVFGFVAKTEKLKNGETFLTNLFKQEVTEETIKEVIKMSLFDVNLANAHGETALMLACERLMTSLVKLLLDNGSDASYNNHAAIESTVLAKKKYPAMENDANEIKDLLMKPKAIPGQYNMNNQWLGYNQDMWYQEEIEYHHMNYQNPVQIQAAKVRQAIPKPICKCDKKIVDIMSLLLKNGGDITKLNEQKLCVLGLAYSINKRFYQMFIQNCRYKIDLFGNPVTESILSKLIEDSELKILNDTLNVTIIEAKYDGNLLNLALKSLTVNRKLSYKTILERCTNVDTIMHNNETFVTSLFKNKVANNSIIDVINSKYFDINVANGKNETALMLACERYMVDVVDVLLKHGADASYGDYRSVDLLVASKYLVDEKKRSAEKVKILNLISGRRDGTGDKKSKLHFVVDNVIDMNKIWNVEGLNYHVRLDDFVETSINMGNDEANVFTGQIKWTGMINGEKCVGVDLGEEFLYGMNGMISDKCKFQCSPGCGIVTPLTSVKRGVAYRTTDIDLETRIFEKLDINSKVVCYVTDGRELKSLYGTIRWSGFNKYKKEFMYGIELEEQYDNATDGKFNGMRLFHCQYNHGIVVSIKKVAPDPRLVTEDIAEDAIAHSKASTVYQFAFPIRTFVNDNTGIQGNKHSTFLESIIFALFAKGDAIDYMISPLLHNRDDIPLMMELIDILSFDIVYPLREFGIVTFHKIKQFKKVLSEFGPKFQQIKDKELTMENFADLLTTLCPMEPLLRFITFKSTYNNSMFLELFLTLKAPLDNISCQKLMEISMVQCGIMFFKLPIILIIQVPRNEDALALYKNILPLKTINISNLLFNNYKQCCECDNMAAYVCKKCVEFNTSVGAGLYCEDDKCLHEDAIELTTSGVVTRSEVLLNLKSIISVDNNHSIAYVKENNMTDRWLRFDSKESKDKHRNCYIPMVEIRNRTSRFLSMEYDEMLNEVNYHNIDPEIMSLLQNAYIYIYENPLLTCY